MPDNEEEKRPRVDSIAEKVLGVIGVIVGLGILGIGAAVFVYGLTVPLFVAMPFLFIGVVVIVGGIVLIWAVFRHFRK